jgi:hypothetical protein
METIDKYIDKLINITKEDRLKWFHAKGGHGSMYCINSNNYYIWIYDVTGNQKYKNSSEEFKYPELYIEWDENKTREYDTIYSEKTKELWDVLNSKPKYLFKREKNVSFHSSTDVLKYVTKTEKQ